MNTTTARSSIKMPTAWQLTALDLSWLQPDPPAETADHLFARLSGSPPRVSLRSRVPTHTLPCRQFVAGEAHGHDLEVALLGTDFSGRVTLAGSREGRRPLTAVAQDVFAAIDDGETRPPLRRQVAVSAELGGLSREVVQARFAEILGIAGEDGIAHQRYVRRRTEPFGADQLLDMEFELLGASESQGAHRLAVTSRASGEAAGWTTLLTAALAVLHRRSLQ